jgi:voltage-gated potassium channel Kch
MAHGSFNHLQAPRPLWWVVITLAVLTLLCGSIGVSRYEEKHSPGAHHGLSSLYHASQMLILHTAHFEEMNGWLEAGRWLGAATLFAATGVVFGKRLRREFRLLAMTYWTDHYIVCGLGHKGLEIAKCFKEKEPGARVVVIDPQPDEHLANECDKHGICIFAADASLPKTLQQARVGEAREIVIITPTDQTNVRIATEVRSHRSHEKAGEAKCHVHVSDIHFREALQQWSEGDGKTSDHALHFFDVFDNEARRVLLDLPLDGTGLGTSDPRAVHVVILGFGRMGCSVALRAAKMGHFANRKPLRISVVDRNADAARERFLFRYPAFKGSDVCKMEFYTAEADSISARDWIEKWTREPEILLHVFVCLEDDARNVEVALRLRKLLNVPDRRLLVRIRSHASLAKILEAAPSPNLPIVPFGMVEDACAENAFHNKESDSVARAIHEFFVSKRLAGSNRSPENDPALRDWDDLREELRESNRQQADHIAIKLRAIGCKMVKASEPGEAIEKIDWKEIEMLAPVEHARWNAERRLAGWRYGTPSNKNLRISENIAEWENLDKSIREYDEQAIADIPAVLQRANPPLKVVRLPSSGS